MRSSDWSSDVCSSDLVQKRAVGRGLFPGDQIVAQRIQILVCLVEKIVKQIVHAALAPVTGTRLWTGVGKFGFKTAWTGGASRTEKSLPRVRSEERGVGKGCVRTSRSRSAPYNEKK